MKKSSGQVLKTEMKGFQNFLSLAFANLKGTTYRENWFSGKVVDFVGTLLVLTRFRVLLHFNQAVQ